MEGTRRGIPPGKNRDVSVNPGCYDTLGYTAVDQVIFERNLQLVGGKRLTLQARPSGW